MKSFEFSLERMRNYKDQVLEKEKTSLRQLQTKKNKIETDIEDLENYRKVKESEFRKEQEIGVTPDRFLSFKFYMENTRHQLDSLYEELVVTEAKVEEQIKVVVKASQEVSGLDKLEEKQLEEYRYLETKENEVQILELVSTKMIGQSR